MGLAQIKTPICALKGSKIMSQVPLLKGGDGSGESPLPGTVRGGGVSGCRRWDDACAGRDSVPSKQSAVSVWSKPCPFLFLQGWVLSLSSKGIPSHCIQEQQLGENLPWQDALYTTGWHGTNNSKDSKQLVTSITNLTWAFLGTFWSFFGSGRMRAP